MNPLTAAFATTKAAVAPYWLWIKIGIVVAIVSLFLWQRHRINSLKEDNELYRNAVAGYAQAQTVNLSTIDDLNARIDNFVESRRLEREAQTKAVADAEAAIKRINADLNSLNKELADVYARTPSARKWADTGVDASVADRLPGGSRSR